jgi:hypothetical protein
MPESDSLFQFVREISGLELNAHMLLVEELPDLELCQFLAAPENVRQARIAEVIYQDGVLVYGRFADLLPISARRSATDIQAVPMPEEWAPKKSQG